MRAPTATSTARAVIEQPRPVVECGALPAKATVGIPLVISGSIFTDGHDLVMGWVRHGQPGSGADTTERWRELPMRALGDDRFGAVITPPRVGPCSFEIVAMPDVYGSWLGDLRVRLDAGQDVTLEL